MHGRMLAHFADLLLKAIWCHGSRNQAEEKRKNGDSNEKKMGPIWRLDRSPASLKVRPKYPCGRPWPFLFSLTYWPINCLCIQNALQNACPLCGLAAQSHLKPWLSKSGWREKKERRFKRKKNGTDLTSGSVASKSESEAKISLMAGLGRLV